MAQTVQTMTRLLPNRAAAGLMRKVGVDRLAALQLVIGAVRRGGTISIVDVYGGMSDQLPMLTLFDKQLQLRMGQANVRHWVDDLLPLLTDADSLGTEQFREKRASAVKVVLTP